MSAQPQPALFQECAECREKQEVIEALKATTAKLTRDLLQAHSIIAGAGLTAYRSKQS